jgi:hypothetical protein
MVRQAGIQELFQECPKALWQKKLAARQVARRQPAPLPVGHLRFTFPREDGWVAVEHVPLEGPSLPGVKESTP